jgi:hypothetical protein
MDYNIIIYTLCDYLYFSYTLAINIFITINYELNFLFNFLLVNYFLFSEKHLCDYKFYISLNNINFNLCLHQKDKAAAMH